MNLIEPIHKHAITRPDAVAIITPQRNFSWSELDSLIWSTALRLNENGLTAGDRVGITMAHPVIHLVTSLALARIGVAHIAIPLSESDFVRKRLVEKLELKIILSDSENVVSAMQNSLLLDKLGVTEVNQNQKQKIGATNGQLTWLILQSSGTTGEKKHAELNHEFAQIRLQRSRALLDPLKEDIFWSGTGLDFVVGKTLITCCLNSGVQVCMAYAFSDSDQKMNYLAESGVTIGFSIPSQISNLLSMKSRLPKFRNFHTAGTTVTADMRKKFRSKTGCFLKVVYSTNETGPLTHTSIDPKDMEHTSDVGQPIHGVEIQIVNSEKKPVSPGTTGELRIKAEGMINTYLSDVPASTRSFKNGWFYSGDLGYLTEEGLLFLQGRKDDMMIFDGINIYPAEIENVLSSHPAVIETAAFAIKHEKFQDVPVAAVTLKEPISEKGLIDYCRTQLGIKHPKRVFILKNFPRNSMGKILKRELSLVVMKMIS
jgi:acyl-coenzyme A synthetase/AMP-(fatty) acid ligase